MICLSAHFFAGLPVVYHFLEFAKSLLFLGFYTQNIVGVVVLVCKLSRYASAETKRALEKILVRCFGEREETFHFDRLPYM